MATELIINASLPETRIALLENGEIQELHIERDSDRGIVGNIYKGKVLRVLPGMQAAFVDIGLEKAAFLYVDDIYFPDMDSELQTQSLPEYVEPPKEQIGEEAPVEPSSPAVESEPSDLAPQGTSENVDAGAQATASQPAPEKRSVIITPNNSNRSAVPPKRFAGTRPDRGPRDRSGRRDPRSMGGRHGGRDQRGKRGEYDRFGGGGNFNKRNGPIPLPRTPEDHAALQREYGKLMMQTGVEDDEDSYARELERKRQEAVEAATKPTTESPSEPVENENVNYNEDDDNDNNDDGGPYPAEMDPGSKDPEDEQPEARSPTTPEDKEESEEETESAAVYRPEPMIDVQAWQQGAERPSETGIPEEEAPSSDEEITEMPKRRRREPINISDLVKEGQEILVQVVKDPIGTKGARLTCQISLPGRYLVFMPTVDHVGVSRRIESEMERRRLKDLISRVRPQKTGVIVRTASGNQSDKKLKADLDFLVQSWNDIQKKFKKQRPCTMVYQDLNIILRSIRDMFTDEVDRVVVDSPREYKSVMKFVTRFMPYVKDKIQLYEGTQPIFDAYGVEGELSRALDRKVWLKSGGYIVIDQAEALVAIDVNTGRYVGKSTLEDTILKTNLEAVEEIAYQLRLRNCGGIIIIDFIDMEKESNREKVYSALEEELKKDRARPTILKISQLGLVEMTRKRTRDSMVRALCEPCRYCEGRGYLKNKLTVVYDILRDIQREGFNTENQGLSLQCHPSVADVLLEDKRDVLEALEHQFGKKISITPNGAYHTEQYELVCVRQGKNVTYTSDERKQTIRSKSAEMHKQLTGASEMRGADTGETRVVDQSGEGSSERSGQRRDGGRFRRDGNRGGRGGRHRNHRSGRAGQNYQRRDQRSFENQQENIPSEGSKEGGDIPIENDTQPMVSPDGQSVAPAPATGERARPSHPRGRFNNRRRRHGTRHRRPPRQGSGGSSGTRPQSAVTDPAGDSTDER